MRFTISRAFAQAFCFNALFCCNAAASAADQSPPTVFVFSSLVLDLNHKLVRFGPQDRALTDCSDEASICLKSDLLSFALPKRCADSTLNQFGSGTNTTLVLERHVPEASNTNPSEDMLLGNPSFPDVVLVYNPKLGVTSIYYDALKKANFFELAKHHLLAERSGEDQYISNSRRVLITFDEFGACK